MAEVEYMPPGYWAGRKHMAYYGAVRQMLEEIGPRGSLLDVGGWDTPVVLWGTFKRRYTCDLGMNPNLPGVRSHVGDFMDWTPPERMSVVTCLQVIEHLPDDVVERFGAKLRASADVTIVSVPYCWPAGRESSHIQDPINHDKLARFMGGRPDRAALIRDGKSRRLIGVWNR